MIMKNTTKQLAKKVAAVLYAGETQIGRVTLTHGGYVAWFKSQPVMIYKTMKDSLRAVGVMAQLHEMKNITYVMK